MTNKAGTAPNTTYGYGKLDVFKAASSTFACAPVDRKTFQYDASTFPNLDTAAGITTQRIAVRFSPDISGKAAGVYYQVGSGSKAPLVVELRANNSGNPGTLLGTVNVPDTNTSRTTWKSRSRSRTGRMFSRTRC